MMEEIAANPDHLLALSSIQMCAAMVAIARRFPASRVGVHSAGVLVNLLVASEAASDNATRGVICVQLKRVQLLGFQVKQRSYTLAVGVGMRLLPFAVEEMLCFE